MSVLLHTGRALRRSEECCMTERCSCSLQYELMIDFVTKVLPQPQAAALRSHSQNSYCKIWGALAMPDVSLFTLILEQRVLGQQHFPRQRRQGKTLLSCIVPLVICIQRSNLLRKGHDELHHCDGVSSGLWSFMCISIDVEPIMIPRYPCCWVCDVQQTGSHVCVCCLSCCF